MKKSLLCLAVAAVCVASPAMASTDTYFATLFGTNELSGGDADGFGLASLSIDNVANSATWIIQAFNIDFPLTGAHIHAAPAGVNGPVIVSFSNALSGSVSDPALASINPGNAGNFYINLHNAAHGGGAIRGQLQYLGTSPVPEPATYGMMLGGLGLVGWLAMRRRKQA